GGGDRFLPRRDRQLQGAAPRPLRERVADVGDEDPEVPPPRAARRRARPGSRLSAWPPVETGRLADALAALAERVAERDVRAQLHALGAVLRNLGGEAAGAEERRALEQALA